MDKRRNLNFINYAKFFGIVLICLGHFLEKHSFLKVAIYSFHVPLFFFISGFLFNPNKNFFNRIGSNALRLLVPYFLWIPISLGFYNNYRGEIFDTWEEIFFIGGTTIWNDPLWFLIVLFFCFLIFSLVLKFVKEKYHILASAIICLASFIFATIQINIEFLGLGKTLTMLGFLALGFILRSTYEKRLSKAKNSTLSVIGIFTFIIFFLIAGFFNNGNNISILLEDYNNIFLFIPLAILGSVSFVLMFMNAKESKIISFFAKNTIPFMAGHYFFRLYWFDFYERTLLYNLLGGILSILIIGAILLILNGALYKAPKAFKKPLTLLGIFLA